MTEGGCEEVGRGGGERARHVFDTTPSREGGSVFLGRRFTIHTPLSACRLKRLTKRSLLAGVQRRGLSFTDSFFLLSSSLTSPSFFRSFEMRNPLSSKSAAN